MEIQYSNINYKLLVSWNVIRTSEFGCKYDNLWKKKEHEGLFRYNLNILKAKFLEGTLHFFAQLNIDRALNKRLPEPIVSLPTQKNYQPFDKTKFNFTRINSEELMFHVLSEHNNEKFGNYIAINVSPLEFGHSILIPTLYEKLPQLLTLNSIEFGIYTLLSNYNPAFRIGFNSLCAYATVNHLHLHAFYLDHKMLLESIAVDHLSGNCYVLERYPSKGYVFQITSLEDVKPIAKDIYTLTTLLIKNNIAHNMYMTRGLRFDRSQGNSMQTSERDCIRIYVWGRTHSPKIKILDEFDPAFCELSGHLLIKSEEAYNKLTEESVAEILTNITSGPFTMTKEKVRILFQTDVT